jgi:hypothetical protein
MCEMMASPKNKTTKSKARTGLFSPVRVKPNSSHAPDLHGTDEPIEGIGKLLEEFYRWYSLATLRQLALPFAQRPAQQYLLQYLVLRVVVPLLAQLDALLFSYGNLLCLLRKDQLSNIFCNI